MISKGTKLRVGVVGPGYIGAAIGKTLLSMGCEVFSYSPTIKNLGWLHTTSISEARGYLQDADKVVLAFGSGDIHSIETASEIDKALEILEALGLTPSNSLFYISSGAVYGDCVMNMSEDMDFTPSTPYGDYKHQMERHLLRNFDSRVTILRVSNPYSLNSTKGIFSTIRDSFIKETDLNLIGHQDDCRDYLSLRETSVLASKLIMTNPSSQVYNIGSGISISLEDIYLIIEGAFKRKRLTINWLPRVSSNVSKTMLNVDRIHAELQADYRTRNSIMTELKALLDF